MIEPISGAETVPGAVEWVWPFVSAICIGVVATVLVPFLTVLWTAQRERLASESTARRAAALEMIAAANLLRSMYHPLKPKQLNQEDHDVVLVPYNKAIADVLLLTRGGIGPLAEYLSGYSTQLWVGQHSKPLELHRVMAEWAPKGKIDSRKIPVIQNTST